VARSSWNPHSPDTIGVQFEGVGITNNVISAGSDMYSLEFTAQQTSLVSSVALYSGAITYNPQITSNSNYLFERRPWIVELIPASGYDPGDLEYLYFDNSITTYSDVVDEVFTAPEGDELEAANDSAGLFQSGPNPATVSIQIDSTGFPTSGIHVLSLGIEAHINRQAYVNRIDQSGSVGWSKLFPVGFSTFHIAEAYREQGTSGYSLLTPTVVRQFDNAVGSRRLQFQGIDIQPMIYDYLNFHVDYITERRAGVGLQLLLLVQELVILFLLLLVLIM
jgi:hypothetical protein